MTQADVKELLGEPDAVTERRDTEESGTVVEWSYFYQAPFTMYIAPTIGMLTIVFCYPSFYCVMSLSMTSGHLRVEFGRDLKVLRAVTDRSE